ncbi:hypothetical protein [Streptomyces sp. NPDC058155]|uniref:hypothetical protein n=1 Tax=Streptomyces sp. NPDC058155 TaxID=3346359 RepID=UPI0036EDEC7F
MSKRTIALWALPPVLALPFAVWELLDDPQTRLTGMILLAALVGFAGVFVIPVIFYAHSEGRMPAFRKAPVWALLLAWVGLTAGALATMGSIERNGPEYVWRYGEPGQVEMSRPLFCDVIMNECSGHRASEEGASVIVRLSEEQLQSYRGDGVLDRDDAAMPALVDAHIMGDRATSLEYGAQPASSVALGRIPAWLGWTGAGVGLAGFALGALVPRRRYSY